MAVYKVPQDVEADDKLIGPFSFRQFVFLLIFAGFLYFAYLMVTISIVLVVIPLPFIVFFAALAFPWRKDQPTEVYLAALIHFWIKPRKRIWNQEGQTEHVHITVPKKIDHHFTDGLSSNEVRSNLHSLAQTLDTRGWASKNVNAPSSAGPQQLDQSDRLVMPKVMPQTQQNPAMAVGDSDDVLDVGHNAIAQNFDNLVNKSTENRKTQLMEQMRQQLDNPQAVQPSQPQANVPEFNPYPSMQQHVIAPGGQPDPVPQQPQYAPAPQQQQTQSVQNEPVNPETQNAILNLANNSDLNVSTIARQAEQAMHSGDTIELH